MGRGSEDAGVEREYLTAVLDGPATSQIIRYYEPRTQAGLKMFIGDRDLDGIEMYTLPDRFLLLAISPLNGRAQGQPYAYAVSTIDAALEEFLAAIFKVEGILMLLDLGPLGSEEAIKRLDLTLLANDIDPTPPDMQVRSDTNVLTQNARTALAVEGVPAAREGDIAAVQRYLLLTTIFERPQEIFTTYYATHSQILKHATTLHRQHQVALRSLYDLAPLTGPRKFKLRLTASVTCDGERLQVSL